MIKMMNGAVIALYTKFCVINVFLALPTHFYWTSETFPDVDFFQLKYVLRWYINYKWEMMHREDFN